MFLQVFPIYLGIIERRHPTHHDVDFDLDLGAIAAHEQLGFPGGKFMHVHLNSTDRHGRSSTKRLMAVPRFSTNVPSANTSGAICAILGALDQFSGFLQRLTHADIAKHFQQCPLRGRDLRSLTSLLEMPYQSSADLPPTCSPANLRCKSMRLACRLGGSFGRQYTPRASAEAGQPTRPHVGDAQICGDAKRSQVLGRQRRPWRQARVEGFSLLTLVVALLR